MCKVKYYSYERRLYHYAPDSVAKWNEAEFRNRLLCWLLAPRCNQDARIWHKWLSETLIKCNLPATLKIYISDILKAGDGKQRLPIHDDSQFMNLSKLVACILGGADIIDKIISEVCDIRGLDSSLCLLIDKLMDKTSDSIRISVTQCLLKSLTCRGEDYIRLYAEWTDYITKEYSFNGY